MHVLEAGFQTPGRPCVVLLHGFPELAYSWRKLMRPFADAGFHVLAPDQRGYGRTTGADPSFGADLAAYAMPNLVEDVLGMLQALGIGHVASVVGHDFGASVAAWCALLRPDVFQSVALMSSPFGGPPSGSSTNPLVAAPVRDMHQDLAQLERPRKHYQWYYSTPTANSDMWQCPQGVHAFLRAYYHVKSADWAANRPAPLLAWSAAELARMPTYYIMDAAQDMAQTVAPHMPGAEAVATNRWLTEDELRVYSDEFQRTGFQGGLNWYRSKTEPACDTNLRQYAGRGIDVPALFIAGASDWGVWQSPGAFERMQSTVCKRMHAVLLLPDAGHWVQQEQPEATASHLLDFFSSMRRA